MTHEDLRVLVTQNEAFDLSSRWAQSGSSPTNEQITSLLNWALRITSRKLRIYDPSVVLTLTASTSTYNLRDTDVVSRKVLRPLRVVINGNTLWDASRNNYGLYSFAELMSDYPSWRSATSGTPAKAVWFGDATNKLLLVPPPTSAVVAAGNNYIDGFVLATDLSTETQEPEIPEELHEMIAYLAAFHGSLPNASEQEGWQRLAAYKSEWLELVNEIAKDNESHMMGPSSNHGMGGELMFS